MRSTPLSALLLLSLVFTSCSGTNGTEEQPAATRPVMVTPDQIIAPRAASSVEASAAPAGVKLNPPHGEPGHRCDIEVGAPLDGAPAPTSTPGNNGQVINVQPGATGTNITAMPASAPTGNSGRINPPHGEPGHDCAVPVGDPLP